jgi:hypothetical protein
MAIFMDAWLMVFSVAKWFRVTTGNGPLQTGFYYGQRIEASFRWQVLNSRRAGPKPAIHALGMATPHDLLRQPLLD